MNLINLKRVYDYIYLVPAKKLDMKSFREFGSNKRIHKCNSVGCILGHAVVLDKWENIPLFEDGEIDFCKWSYKFLDIACGINTWSFMFGGEWSENEETNSKEQILARMRYVLDNNGKLPLKFTDENAELPRFSLIIHDVDIHKEKSFLTKLFYEFN